MHELDGDAPASQLVVDLRPRAVNHDDLVPEPDELPHPTRGARRDAPAELDHDAAHVVYSAFSRT